MKKFIKKIVSDVKFADAGPGHRLTEQPSSSSRPNPAPKANPVRKEPTRDAKTAGAAALARLEAANNKSSVMQSQKLQLRRQMDKEQRETATTSNQPPPREPEVIEQVGIQLKCPICSASHPKPNMSSHYESCLEQRLERDPLSTTCIMIHTLNTGDLLTNGMKTLSFFVENVIKDRDEVKYKKIRVSNAGVQKKVMPLVGGTEFLELVGFSRIRDDADGEEYFILLETPPNEHLQKCVDTLASSTKLTPTLDRDVKVLQPDRGVKKIDFSPDFYRITREDVMSEHRRLTDEVARNQVLRTKEMRERDAGVGMRIYHYAVIRVRFPDGLFLQGTFSAHDVVESVFKFVDDSLRKVIEYNLILPGCPPLKRDQTTLKAAGLVPSVTLTLSTPHRSEFTLLSDEYVSKLC